MKTKTFITLNNMKKTFLAIAAVAMSIAAQAATAKWSANTVNQVGTSDKATGYLCVFIESSAYSQANAAADIAAGNTDFATTYAKTGASKTTNNGAASASGWGSYGNSESVTGYLVIFNASTIADATQAYVTAEATGTTGASGQAATLAFGSQATATSNASNWKTVGSGDSGAPEPTSGLLLLVGAGILGLRRKRA